MTEAAKMQARRLVLACVLVGLSVFATDAAGIQQEFRSPPSTLVKLAIVHRHGDRSPLDTYPTDPYPYTDLNHWPDGAGQLTTNGKKRMLRLGQLIRVKYDDFLTQNPIESYVRSSAVDRCLASAELVMAGIYPPTGRQVFNPNINWQPIPIHSRNMETDGMLVDQKYEDCEARETAKQLQLQADSAKEYMEKNRDLVQKVANGTGMNITTVRDAGLVYGVLKCDREAGKRLPGWVTDDVMGELDRLADVSMCVTDSGQRLQRLDAGVFFHDLEQVFASSDPFVIDDIARKAFFYSTHDTRMVPILKAMNASDGRRPNYGSSIIFEMHEVDGKALIRTSYLRDPMKEGGDVVPLKTRGCPEDNECSVQQFFSGLREFITDEETHRKECEIIPVVPQEVDCIM